MSINLFDLGRGAASIVEGVAQWGPRILAALAILLVTHFLAKIVQRGVTRIGLKPAWKRTHMSAETTAAVLAQAGKLGYWLIWLFGFVAALQPLELGEVVTPLNILLSQIGSFVPKFIGAAAILIVGVALAKIMRELTMNAVAMLHVDRILCPAGAKIAERTKVRTSFAIACGSAVQLVVLLPIALAAIDALGITALTIPLRQLLAVILEAVPHLVAASLIVVMGFGIGRWVAKAAEDFLAGVGVDEATAAIGLGGEAISFSRVGYHIVLVAIMLFAVTEAARLIGFPFVSHAASEIIALGGRMVFGAALIAGAFAIARIIGRLFRDAGIEKFGILAGYVVIGIGLAMGLSFMGIATDIVTIAFALVLGAAAVAFAVSFGLGGRETAHQLLQDWKRRSRPNADASAAPQDRTPKSKRPAS